jgi:hypothetical protein
MKRAWARTFGRGPRERVCKASSDGVHLEGTADALQEAFLSG